MKNKTLIFTLFALVIIVILLLTFNNTCNEGEEYFSDKDKEAGNEALKHLELMLSRNKNIPEISDEELDLAIKKDQVHIVKIPGDKPSKDGREGMSFSKSINTRIWPYYYYSQPYNPESGGGAWPDGLHTRLRYWSPGFYTTGFWQHHLRPGMGYKFWPRNRWVRHRTQGKNSYYLLGNGDDQIHKTLTLPPKVNIRYLGGS